MAIVLSLKSSYNRNSPKRDPIIRKVKISSYKQIVTKILEIIFDALHFTIRAVEGVPKAKFTKHCTFGFGLM
jgi:hypothetical protein